MKKSVLGIWIALLVFSCGCDGEGATPNNDGYDRKTILENVVDNIIVPTYHNFQIELEELELAATIFINSSDQANLIQLRLDWIDAYIAWQHLEMYNIGKAEELFFSQKMNTYPCNVSTIENKIATENYDFLTNTLLNFSTQGFPALDYMLYGIADGDVLSKYQGAEAERYKVYLSEVINDMISNTDMVVDYWDTERTSFINEDGNTATSSLNMLVNEFIYFYEKGFRANKFGIPAGVWSGTLPGNVEAYYKRNISKELALEAMESVQKFFIGTSFDNASSGGSLYDYLAHLDSKFLADAIVASFENAELSITTLNDSFATQVEDDNIQMLEVYDDIQAAVVKLKTEMLYALNISVDYVDSDGD
tara:strand:- start:2092 stop:3183 length:1092 start_codon:yes stop_codon:yes gene_type:complete